MTNSDRAPSTFGSPLLRDGRLLVYLFVSFRLILLLVHQPLPPYTPGLTGFGDFAYFHGLASLADQGKLPYRDYWFEYPPVVALVSQGVYSVISLRGGDFTAYAVMLGLVLTAFDVGNLLLIRRIGMRLHGPGTGIALAWIYAMLPAPLIISFWSFDTIVAFFTLLAIASLIDAQRDRSAIADALGGLTKLMPLILLGAVWRFRPAREALRYSVIAIGITAAGLLAMLAFAGPYGLPSLRVQFSKSSAETVWALMDGNYTTGILSPDHFDPASASQPQGNPPLIPAVVRTAIFAAIGLFVYATTRRRDNRGLLAFIGVSFALLYLWSANWSPQWQVVLIPLVLLNFPSRQGVLFIITLAFVSFIEYPVMFAHTTGAIPPAQVPLFAALILARTLLLIGFAWALYRRLRVPGLEDVNSPS